MTVILKYDEFDLNNSFMEYRQRYPYCLTESDDSNIEVACGGNKTKQTNKQQKFEEKV